MNISNESLELLDVAIKNNPRHSPLGHPSDYDRWIEFVICIYKNDDYIEPWDLYEYLIENGYENFIGEAERFIKHCIVILDFINHLENGGSPSENKLWLIKSLMDKVQE